MRPLLVLIACEESGTVRDAFTRRGHYAMSCDLQPTRAPWGPHHAGNVVPLLGLGWDLLISHPPCTFLSSSGLHWNKNPNSPRYGGGANGGGARICPPAHGGPDSAQGHGESSRVHRNPHPAI